MLKRLIEVALPLKEVSEQSAREKSIRHGHISTLHIWWARRPLAACRAAVFASLIPDADDPDCPARMNALMGLSAAWATVWPTTLGKSWQNYTGLTFSAHGPFGPRPSVYDTFWPSCRSSKLTPSTLDEWKNRSLSPPVLMNPKPLSVNLLIVPSAICAFPVGLIELTPPFEE